MKFNYMLTKIKEAGIIAVLVIEDIKHAVPIVDCLLNNGITAMELALRTPIAFDAIALIKSRYPQMLAGVGTILTPDQVGKCVSIGADFGVSPGLNPSVVQCAQQLGLPFAPGIATPSDIERGLELNCNVFKLFPAEPSGGIKYLESIAAPYKHMNLKYIPLGGITFENMQQYFDTGLVPAVGGSWIAPQKLIRDENWAQISANAKQASDLIKKLKTQKKKIITIDKTRFQDKPNLQVSY